MTRRNGSTLVELVLSMSAGSAIMLLAISLVHQTMTLTEKSRHRSDNNRTLDQLAHHFRRDVHLAAEIDVVANDTLSIKSTDGSQVTYKTQNQIVVRERKYASQEKENERFVLADASSASFQSIPNPERASLIVSSDSGLYGVAPRVDLHVETLMGRWQALERSAEESE